MDWTDSYGQSSSSVWEKRPSVINRYGKRFATITTFDGLGKLQLGRPSKGFTAPCLSSADEKFATLATEPRGMHKYYFPRNIIFPITRRLHSSSIGIPIELYLQHSYAMQVKE